MTEEQISVLIAELSAKMSIKLSLQMSATLLEGAKVIAAQQGRQLENKGGWNSLHFESNNLTNSIISNTIL